MNDNNKHLGRELRYQLYWTAVGLAILLLMFSLMVVFHIHNVVGLIL